jgi:hypothetical protein
VKRQRYPSISCRDIDGFRESSTYPAQRCTMSALSPLHLIGRSPGGAKRNLGMQARGRSFPWIARCLSSGAHPRDPGAPSGLRV